MEELTWTGNSLAGNVTLTTSHFAIGCLSEDVASVPYIHRHGSIFMQNHPQLSMKVLNSVIHLVFALFDLDVFKSRGLKR